MDKFEDGGYAAAIGVDNKPKIFPDQNDSDSAPKVGEEYQKRIEEIMNIQVEFDGGDDIENYLGENELWDFTPRLKNVNGTVIETYLTITSDPERFRKYKMKAWQIEYPPRGGDAGKWLC